MNTIRYTLRYWSRKLGIVKCPCGNKLHITWGYLGNNDCWTCTQKQMAKDLPRIIAIMAECGDLDGKSPEEALAETNSLISEFNRAEGLNQ